MSQLFTNNIFNDLALHPALLDIYLKTESDIEPYLQTIRDLRNYNQYKVLQAFRRAKVTDYHLTGTTGYGYSDVGRDTLDEIFAHVFGAEAALVRTQIVSGTHAIALCYFGVLRPGDKLISVTGRPYDTLEKSIGIQGSQMGSLRDWGIDYEQVELTHEGKPNYPRIADAVNDRRVRMVTIQRSRGYSPRPSLTIDEIEELIRFIKAINREVICFVDNCYGELVESKEPTQVGADLIAGSLIKNMGGGLAPTGGYVIGRKDLVEQAAYRLTAPGLGRAVGATGEMNRLLYQGLFLAPQVVSEALQGAIFTARFLDLLGFSISPRYDEKRSDIIQAIDMGSAEKMIAFCQGLQKGSPIDSHVVPEPAGMPGYEDAVIMAGGTFVQGASIELSADGPLRSPFYLYLQGGLGQTYVKIALLLAVQELTDRGLILES